jgi:hypothetical protein
MRKIVALIVTAFALVATSGANAAQPGHQSHGRTPPPISFADGH